jgi:Protein of unknown function (DUF1553)/Protein of unknown function (DUF1549)
MLKRATWPALIAGLGLVAVLSNPPRATADTPGDSTAERGGGSPAEITARLDAALEGLWEAEEVRPAGPADDAEFLRRVSLDVAGVIPDEASVRAFLSDRDRDKRAAKIRELIGGPGYSRTMATRWAYLLVGRDYLIRSTNIAMRQRSDPAAMSEGAMDGGMTGGADAAPDTYDGPVPPLVGWLEGQLEANTPWDEVVRELIAAEGTAVTNPATHFTIAHLRSGGAEEMAGVTARLFQGVQIQCAQCHDHPYTDWTQNDFYGVAAFFARARVRRTPPPEGSDRKRGPFRVTERGDAQIRLPAPDGQRGRLVLPRYLTGDVPNPTAGARRSALADMMTAEDNPYFARAIVNRTWGQLFGRGLLEPVDDLEQTGGALGDILDMLAADFRASGYDLQRLVEVIVSSRAYQLSSGGDPEDGNDQLALFARARMRALSAEQLFYSVYQATGVEDVAAANPRQRQRLERAKFAMLRQFLQTFGDDEAQEVVEEGTIPQALLLLNGPLSNDAVAPRRGHPLYEQLLAQGDMAQRVETLYLRTLGRLPTRTEARKVVAYLNAAAAGDSAAGGQPRRGRRQAQAVGERAQAYADVVWALLNSSEFSLNH